MRIEEIVGAEFYQTVKISRNNSEKYEEVILHTSQLSNLCKNIQTKLGPPIISDDMNLTEETKKAIGFLDTHDVFDAVNAHGGIWKGQTLFYGPGMNSKVILMIWPWADRNHLTIKKIIL